MNVSRPRKQALWALVPLALIVVWLLSSRGEDARNVSASLSLAEAMGGADTVGYARAFAPRPFEFPRDHGAHPEFRTEWWYFTGNLDARDGRRFGFQFTIFRSALRPVNADPEAADAPAGPAASAAPGAAGAPDAVASTGSAVPPDSTSAWITPQMYMGHFTVTDVEGNRFTEFERFTRGGAGLAGAEAGAESPLRIWLDDWRIEGPANPERSWPMRLRAADEGVALSLAFVPRKDIVLQGDQGLSQKGPEPGNASYYYSYPRLTAGGTLEIDGEVIDVEGLAWLDREWSTSALGEGQVGWDWFSLQFDDGAELMVYDIRQADGTPSPESQGVWVAPDGYVLHLESADYTLTPTGRWTSPIDGASYPSGWRIDVPQIDLELDVAPVLRDQELDVTVRYWEGAVDVSGRRASRELAGRGYVELTGYAGSTR